MTTQYETNENSFNILRYVFAALVIVSHTYSLIDGNRSREPLCVVFGTVSLGDLAVDGFFLLSGFLITRSWIRKPDPSRFMSHRIRRVYPGFMLAYTICLTLVGLIGWGGNVDYFRQIDVARSGLRLVLLMAPNVKTAFPGSFYDALNGSMWTVMFEFCCYVMVLLLGIAGLLRRRRMMIAVAATLLALNGIITMHGPAHEMPYLVQLVSAMIRFSGVFLTGSLYYLYKPFFRPTKTLIAMALLALLIGLRYPLTAEASIAVAGGYLLFAFALATPRLGKISARLPDYSYGIYLYGWPIQKIVISIQKTPDIFLTTFASLLISVVAGALSWHAAEKYFLKYRPAKRAGDLVDAKIS